VIGAGLAGLGVSAALVRHKGAHVTLFDSKGVGGGASQYALGLFNLFAGAKMRLNQWGYAPLLETYPLIEEAQKNSSEKIIIRRGLIKIATTDQQREDFSLAARTYSEIIPMKKPDHYFIATALTLNTQGYMEGLFQSLLGKGLIFKKNRIESLKELEDFDAIVVAAGMESLCFRELSEIVLRPIKGQILKGSLKKQIKYPLSSKVHIVPQTGNEYILGATYERHPETLDPEMSVAKQKILPELTKFYSDFDPSTIKSCESGVRAATPNHLPYFKEVKEDVFAFVGLGSKGLLCHAVLGKELVFEIMK